MSIWNKILLGCIAVTALVLLVLTARALQAHRVWRESYNKHVEAIAAEQQKADEILNGNPEAGQMGLREAKLELYKILIGRGRVWDNILPVKVEKGPDPESQITPPPERILITLQAELPDAIEANTVVYAFQYQPPAADEETKLPSERGAYLGQFTVMQVGGNQIIVRPTVRLSDSELARVQAGQQNHVPWRLYELMPADNRDVLAKLTKEEKELLFPNDTTFGDAKYGTINDYLYDGQIITRQEAETMNLNGKVVLVDEAGNPVLTQDGLYTEVKDGKGMFIRTLRDYEVYFGEGHRIRSMVIDRILAARRDLQFLKESLADSVLQERATQKEIQDLQAKKATVSQQRDAVLQHEGKLDRAIDNMNRVIDELMVRNEAAVAQLAQVQTETSRIINNRTASVVQAPARQATAP